MAAERKKGASGKAGKAAGSRVRGILRGPFLVSIGALSLAEEQLSDLMELLAKEGEKAERSGRKYIKKLAERGSEAVGGRNRRAEKRTHQAEQEEDPILRALRRLNIPTREDIAALDKRVDALLKKIA